MPENERATRKRAAAPASARRERASIWRRIGRGSLLALTFAFPWFFIPLTPSPAGTARVLLASVLAVAGLVALLAETVQRRRLTYPGSWASVGVLGVVVATVASALFSIAPVQSFFGGLLAADALLHVLVAAIVFVLAAVFITDRGDLVRLLTAFVAGAGIASLLAVIGLLGAPSVLAYAPAAIAELGFVAVLALGIACLVPLGELGSRAQAFLFGSAALSLLALVLMNFRILWVAVALIALFSAAAGFVRRMSIGVPLGLSLIALVFVLVGTHLPSFAVASVEVRPDTRTTLASATRVLSGARALVGTGPDTYGYALMQDRTAEANLSPFWQVRFDQGVSYLATVPVTTGILGIAAWLLVLVGGALLAWRRLDDPAAPYAVLAAGLAGLGLLVYPGSFAELLYGAIGLGLLVGITGRRREAVFSGRSSWPLFTTFLALIVITAGSVSGLYLVGERYAAAAYFAAGSRAVSSGDTDLALRYASRAADLDAGSDAYQRTLSQAVLLSFQAKAAATTSTAPSQEAQQQLQSLLQAALAAAQRATALNERDPANWSNLGGIYEGLTPYLDGASDLALQAYDHAASVDPTNPAWPLARARTYLALAQAETAKGDAASETYAKAEEQVEAALALKEDYADARFLSAQAALMRGDRDRGLARVRELRARNGSDATLEFQIGLMLYQNALYGDARADLERAVSLNESFANARYFLGLTYSQLGMRDQATVEFQRLATDNPDSAEIRKILENLATDRPVLEGVSAQPTTRMVPADTTE